MRKYLVKYWILLAFSDSLKKYVPCVGTFCCGLGESKRLAKWYAKKLNVPLYGFLLAVHFSGAPRVRSENFENAPDKWRKVFVFSKIVSIFASVL